MKFSKMPLAILATAGTVFGLGCFDEESPADVAVVQQAQVLGEEILECASGDRTLELRAAIERIKAAGGGTLKLRSKQECPGGYQYSAQPNPNHPEWGAEAFNGAFDSMRVALVPITVQSTRTPAVPNSTRIDISSQDLALLWTNGAAGGVKMQSDTFRYLEFRGPDWNNSNYVDWELSANQGQYGLNGGSTSNWVIDHSVIRGFRNNGVLADTGNAKVQHSVIQKNARTGLAF